MGHLLPLLAVLVVPHDQSTVQMREALTDSHYMYVRIFTYKVGIR